MQRLRRIAGWGLFHVVALAGVSLEVRAAGETRWFRKEGPGVEVISSDGEIPANALLRSYVGLRSVFCTWFKTAEVSPTPVTIIAFGNARQYSQYAERCGAFGAGAKAFTLAQPDRVIFGVLLEDNQTLRNLDNGLQEFTQYTSAEEQLHHGFAHYLFGSTGQHPATWYLEGMCELFQTANCERREVQVGQPPFLAVARLIQNRWKPLTEVISTGSGPAGIGHAQGEQFLFESWALLHFLHLGDSGIARQAVDRFVRTAGSSRALQGVDAEKLVQDCLGCSASELQRRVRAYLDRPGFSTVLVPVAADVPNLEKTPAALLKPHEIAFLLAELDARTSPSDDTRTRLITAGGSDNPRVLETLGAIASFTDRGAAFESWARALSGNSTNDAVVRAAVALKLQPCVDHFELNRRLPEAEVADLRKWLEASLARTPVQSAGFEYLAWLESVAPQPRPEVIQRVQSNFRHVAQRTRTFVALAVIRARIGKTEEALAMLDGLKQLPRDPVADAIAATLRENIAAQRHGTPSSAAN